MKRTALIAGTTGLIGGQLIQYLLEDENYSKIISLGRRESGIKHEKLSEIIIDFDHLDEVKDKLAADSVFICLGSTMKKAGSKEKFHLMDHSYPLQIAEIACRNGANQLSIVSALGADEGSSFFYNRVKGELENDIAKLPFDQIHIYRPSLLIGDREESRIGETMAQGFYKALGWAFIGPVKKYKGIDSSKVAQSMHLNANSEEKGVFFYESDVINEMDPIN